jgi:hypothetical protein
MGQDDRALPEGIATKTLGASMRATDFNFQEDFKFDLEKGSGVSSPGRIGKPHP